MVATGEQLQQAYTLIQNGQKQHAANMLTVLLADDCANAEAWWLLALAATSPDVARRALTRVLDLCPTHPHARHMLDSLSVRQSLMQAKVSSQEMRAHAQPLPPAFPGIAGERPFADHMPPLRRRTGGRQSRPRAAALTPFHAMLVLSILFGLFGCAVFTYAAFAGMQVVGLKLTEFQPSLPIVLSGSADQPDMGNVNTLGNLSYQQWRSGALAPAEQHGYTFTGAGNDFVLIEANATDAQLDPALALYAPDGSLVASSADIDPANRNARVSLHLPAAGQYTIVVSAQNAQGSYQLSLRH